MGVGKSYVVVNGEKTYLDITQVGVAACLCACCTQHACCSSFVKSFVLTGTGNSRHQGCSGGSDSARHLPMPARTLPAQQPGMLRPTMPVARGLALPDRLLCSSPLAHPQVPALSPRQLKLMAQASLNKDASAVAATADGMIQARWECRTAGKQSPRMPHRQALQDASLLAGSKQGALPTAGRMPAA